jgi:hypothetical protein
LAALSGGDLLEIEPNDTSGQAQLLPPGTGVRSKFDDAYDFYAINVTYTGTLQIALSEAVLDDIDGKVQIQVFYPDTRTPRIGSAMRAPYRVDVPVAQTGVYFVMIYTDPSIVAQARPYRISAQMR